MEWTRLARVHARPVRWIGSSKDDLKGFPQRVCKQVGWALWIAQLGSKIHYAKPLTGFGGAGVVEVVVNFDGNTYRAVYTVRFENALYVLHVFQKKSRSGVETLQSDIQLVRRRLTEAEKDYHAWQRSR